MTEHQPRRSATLREFLRLPNHVLSAWIAYRLSKIEDKLNRLHQEVHNIMADAATILAKVTANTDALKSARIVIDGLKEGQTSIADEIAALKKQIADGQPQPDFTALDTAVDEQSAVIAGATEAIGANLKPSGN